MAEQRFYRRNKYPLIMEREWEKLPWNGQRVEVDYGLSTNNNVWYRNGRFVNKYGTEMHYVTGWRPYFAK